MLAGVTPGAALLARFPRVAELYAPLLAALRGDVERYDAAMAERARERALVRLGVYLALERAREVAVTRLLRRVWRLAPTTRVPLARMAAALQWRGAADDAAGAEWLVATQIARGRIKGYVAHERQMLVLSATDPFPRPTMAMVGS